MSHPIPTSAKSPENAQNKRRSNVQRMVTAQLASMGGTLSDTIGQSNRQRLVWLGLLALPLLFPIALPGMGSAVGALCVLIAIGLCTGQSLQLPAWLARRELNLRVKSLLIAMINRTLHLLARAARPRMLPLSNKPASLLNGSMLFVAGLSMMVPVPVISFDNVLPALAIVLISWGLRLRDGLMLLAGYLATVVAVASVMLLWWGGSQVVTYLFSLSLF
ncbi:MAG: hypothetical protein RL297_37 [Pseudomonadota bacterium]|jgi:hypothetical protein